MAGASPATICGVTPGRDADATSTRWTRWLLAGLVLPAVGAAATVALVEGAGGDFGSWETWQAVAACAACAVVPAVVAAWVVRHDGWADALLWAVVCVGVQVALVFGVGFLALGFGPE
jgi:hypothetical protein